MLSLKRNIDKGARCCLVCALFVLSCLTSVAQSECVAEHKDWRALRLGFYNVQNLFDTINDPGVDDSEYVDNKSYDYEQKLKDLSQAISLFLPDMLGVCEIENYRVMDDLAQRVKKDGVADYNIVHYDSRDSRGIDVALMYNPSKFKLIASELVENKVSTRGFLRAEFRIGGDDLLPLVVYVVHLPSKRGGAEAKIRRERALEVVDSLALSEQVQRVVVCGDFNDVPKNHRVLYNMAYELQEQGLGSYAYGDVWSMLDQFIITPELRRYVSEEGQKVLLHRSLLTPNGRYRGYPRRDQPSDHLPVYLDFNF